MQMKDCERIDIMEDKQSNVCWIYSEKYDLHTYRVSKVECCATPNCPRYWKFTTCRNRSTPVLFVDQFQETMANEWENFQAMEVGDVMNLPENTFIDPDDRQIVQGMYRADIKVTVTPI